MLKAAEAELLTPLQLLQQMQNPQTQQLMSNPEALAAIMQIQQGMDRLRAAAPDLYQSMGLPSLPPNLVPNPAAAGVVLSFQTQICFLDTFLQHEQIS